MESTVTIPLKEYDQLRQFKEAHEDASSGKGIVLKMDKTFYGSKYYTVITESEIIKELNEDIGNRIKSYNELFNKLHRANCKLEKKWYNIFHG